jgi:TorA maturation chaperone TorD/hemerythrin-like domain-containing protein
MNLVTIGGNKRSESAGSEMKNALARASLCRALSLAFRLPGPDLARQLKELADTIGGEEGARIRALPELEQQFHRVLGAGGVCPANESDHLPWRTVGGKGAILGDVAAFYEAFRFDPTKEHRESPDHLAIELSFLGWLSFQEAYAIHGDRREERALCRSAIEKFTEEHLATWLERFTGRMAAVAEEGFYRAASELLARYVQWMPAASAPRAAPDDIALSGVPLDDCAGAPIAAEEVPPRPVTSGLSSEHRVIERELDALERAAERGDFERIQRTLAFFDVHVALHRRKEEEILFPALSDVPALAHGPVRVMLLEHEEERRMLEALGKLVYRTDPREREEARAAVKTVAASLIALLRAHITKEDGVLYRIAEDVLAGPPGVSIRETLDAMGYIQLE